MDKSEVALFVRIVRALLKIHRLLQNPAQTRTSGSRILSERVERRTILFCFRIAETIICFLKEEKLKDLLSLLLLFFLI